MITKINQFSLLSVAAFFAGLALYLLFVTKLGSFYATLASQGVVLFCLGVQLSRHDHRGIMPLFGLWCVFLGLSVSLGVRKFEYPDGFPHAIIAIFWTLFPGGPIIANGVASILIGSRYPGAVLGAFCGAVIAISSSYAVVMVVVMRIPTASIFVGLLLLALPIYLPVFMLVGGGVGEAMCNGSRASEPSQPPKISKSVLEGIRKNETS